MFGTSSDFPSINNAEKTMNSKVKQLILDAAVEKVNDHIFERLMDDIHEAVTDSMVDVLGNTLDFDNNETMEVMMELCGRIAIVALPE
jgi:hypothetical protein